MFVIERISPLSELSDAQRDALRDTEWNSRPLWTYLLRGDTGMARVVLAPPSPLAEVGKRVIGFGAFCKAAQHVTVSGSNVEVVEVFLVDALTIASD